MTSNDPFAASPVCPRCGATLGGGELCWLCGASLTQASAAPASAAPAVAHHRHAGFSYSISTLLLVTTLAAIVLGIAASAPGLGIFIAMLLAPVLLRTMMVVRAREAAGLDVGPAKKTALVATSLLATAAILGVTCCAAFCSFCTACIFVAGFGGSGNNSELLGFLLLSLVGALISWLLLYVLIRRSRARFRRDKGITECVPQSK
jgi:hypothetical protein